MAKNILTFCIVRASSFILLFYIAIHTFSKIPFYTFIYPFITACLCIYICPSCHLCLCMAESRVSQYTCLPVFSLFFCSSPCHPFMVLCFCGFAIFWECKVSLLDLICTEHLQEQFCKKKKERKYCSSNCIFSMTQL